MSRLLRLSLDPGDVSKLEVLKKRFIFSEDIDVIRYLLTNAYEEIAAEVIEYQRSIEEKNHEKPQPQQAPAPTTPAIQ